MTAMFNARRGVMVAALFGSAAIVSAVPANANVADLKVMKEVRHDTSLPLRDMIRIYNQQHRHDVHVGTRVMPLLPGPATRKVPGVPDGIQGNSMAPGPVQTTDLLNFDGVDDAHSLCSCAPPDTNGAVGATQYVQWVNTAFSIFNKSTGALISGPTAGNAFWTGFAGRCQSNNDGDPIAQYDKAAGRWVMLQPVFSNPYKMCIAVSQTSDATGAYNRYEFDFANVFPDYPKLGMWPAVGNGAYFLTIRAFLNGSQFQGSQACGMDRTSMLVGAAATIQCKTISGQDGVLPQDFDGTTLPPAAEDELFMNHTGTSSVNFWKMHVDFVNSSNTTLTGPTTVSVPGFTQASSVPQKGTTQRLDALSGFTMYRLAYRNFGDHESLVTNHSVSVNTRAAVRWYSSAIRALPSCSKAATSRTRPCTSGWAAWRWTSRGIWRPGSARLRPTISPASAMRGAQPEIYWAK